MSHKAYIAVGTNLGNRLANYRKAVDRINALQGTRITRESSLYESEPHGKARNWFLNGVVEARTELEPQGLLKALQKIETSIGRKRQRAKATVSRIIDLDILLFDSIVLETRKLVIPHPEIHKRRFVLLPLSELVPGLKHPIGGQTVSALLVASGDTKKVVLFRPHTE